MSDRDRTIARHLAWLACGVVLHVAISLVTSGSACARAGRAEVDLDSLRGALELYQGRHGDYPEGFGALVADGILSRMPKDPWGYDYQYSRQGEVILITSPGLCADHGGRTLMAPRARTSP